MRWLKEVLEGRQLPRCIAPTADNNQHAYQGHATSDHVGRGERYAVDDLEPSQGRCHVGTAVSCIYPPASRRMQGEKPGKHSQAYGSWYEQPDRASLSQPVIRKKTTDDFGQSSYNEQEKSLAYNMQLGFVGATAKTCCSWHGVTKNGLEKNDFVCRYCRAVYTAR